MPTLPPDSDAPAGAQCEALVGRHFTQRCPRAATVRHWHGDPRYPASVLVCRDCRDRVAQALAAAQAWREREAASMGRAG